MSYTALYRRLRPKSFEEVIGQEHIIKTLKNQIETDRITHAYLFCGTRGTGKTSTAKIFAKLLNCKKPANSSPCDNCEMCKAFDENRSLNVIEIDAASNNGVDDIREIREEVKYPPTDGKYKIYIIDEVHMLSIGAFNALLKTLEEPPEHIIFILATTDPHKIPVTILSRCQRFDFKRICSKDMVLTIKKYMSYESINITDEALYYIAKISDGAMRDALSILDQCISFYYGEDINLDRVLEIVGAVDDEIFFRFTESLIKFDTISIITIINEIIQNGRDISQFISDMINHFRNLIVVKSIRDENSIVDISIEKVQKLKEQADRMENDYIIKLINGFSDMNSNLKYAFDERIILEAGCIKLCSVAVVEDISDVKEKIKMLEQKLENAKSEPIYIQSTPPPIIQEKKEEKLRELALSEDLKTAIENYKMLVNCFDMPEKIYLEKAIPKNLEDKFLYLIAEEAFIPKTESIVERAEEELFNLFNKKYYIKVISKEKYDIEYRKVASQEPKNNRNIENIDIEKIADMLPMDITEINE